MVDEIKSQIVNSVTSQTEPQITAFFDDLRGQLQLFITVAIILSVISAAVMLMNLVQRMRSHAALMRIDKNLQRLVDATAPTEIDK